MNGFVRPLALLFLTLPTFAAAQTTLGGGLAGSAWTSPPPVSQEDPWRLGSWLSLPDWLDIGGAARLRYESFDEQFRASGSGSAQGWFSRVNVKATARHENHAAVLEIMDSRKYDTPTDLSLNNGQVNALDILQLHVGTQATNLLADGDELKVLLGRHTMNVGSRRLVARNRYRNTINAFTGVNAVWERDQDTVRAFYTFPVQRLPRDSASLRDNDIELDEERTQVKFFGVHAARKELLDGATGELYVLGLDEDDGHDLATRNRELWTIGARLNKKAPAGGFGYEVEAVFQTGDSRASSGAGDTTDLDHQAEFFHLSGLYRWDTEMDPRLEFLFDWASGDDDPTDGEQNRFDTLFGARRFEFGPTGIFGAFARANLMSPGLRLKLNPVENVEVMVADRFHWLASDQDAWTTSGLADPTGAAGDYIGNLAEIRVRWDPRPELRFETGVAHFFAGDFVEDAPNATTQDDTTYVYLATVFKF